MKKNIFNIWILALTLAVSTSVLTSCDSMANLDKTVLLDFNISGPGVSNHEVTIEIGNTLQLSCREILGGMSEVVWKSYDESIATIDANGVVTPVAPGRVKITAYSDTENVRNGDYVFVTVVAKGMSVVNDALDQSLAD